MQQFRNGLVGLGVLLIMFSSCVPPTANNNLEIAPDITNQSHQAIWNFQDRRDATSLISYLTSEDVTERNIAAKALCSVQDITAKDGLLTMLNSDKSEENRVVAAYALGQLGDAAIVSSLIQSFGSQDTSNYNSPVRGAILEAIGKCGGEIELKQIASVSTYRHEDNHLLLGQIRAIYRFGLRGIFDPLGTGVALKYLSDASFPADVRQLSASFLQRSTALDLHSFKSRLLDIFNAEKDVLVQAPLASVLGRLNTSDDPSFLDNLRNVTDYRVKCNGLRAMNAGDNSLLMDSILTFLTDENSHVRNTAAELLATQCIPNRAGELLDLAKNVLNDDPLKARLLESALKAVPAFYTNTRAAITNEITNGLANTNNAYRRVDFIKALSAEPTNYPIIKKEIEAAGTPVEKTTAILALNELLNSPSFPQIVRSNSVLSAYRKSIVDDLISIFESDDAGAMAAACTVVRNETLDARSYIELKAPLRQALRNLKLPEETETQYEIESVIDFLNDTTTLRDLPAYNHPIAWEHIVELSDSARAYISTTKGQIGISLSVDDAPASVANFVKLANDNFYNGKFVHRVVPNFVIQTGCPRGDGYGGLGYSIRSELTPHYYDDEGYVGMASAGKDTEGTQWFITHSPTPHLDGRYTIFAKVIEGMDVVHAIQPGDIIQDIRILKR